MARMISSSAGHCGFSVSSTDTSIANSPEALLAAMWRWMHPASVHGRKEFHSRFFKVLPCEFHGKFEVRQNVGSNEA
jgi:hypothetical protein